MPEVTYVVHCTFKYFVYFLKLCARFQSIADKVHRFFCVVVQQRLEVFLFYFEVFSHAEIPGIRILVTVSFNGIYSKVDEPGCLIPFIKKGVLKYCRLHYSKMTRHLIPDPLPSEAFHQMTEQPVKPDRVFIEYLFIPESHRGIKISQVVEDVIVHQPLLPVVVLVCKFWICLKMPLIYLF